MRVAAENGIERAAQCRAPRNVSVSARRGASNARRKGGRKRNAKVVCTELATELDISI